MNFHILSDDRVVMELPDGSEHVIQNSELIPAYYWMPGFMLMHYEKDKHWLPRRPSALFQRPEHLELIESNLFREAVCEGMAQLAWIAMDMSGWIKYYSPDAPQRIMAYDTENYYDEPDVIFLCVKSYSLKSLLPFLKKIVKSETIVIPTLNVFGTGKYLKSKLPRGIIMDGCIYVTANIKSSGWILMHSDILRVIFGPRVPEDYDPRLEEIEQDLKNCGIDAKLSDMIQRDCMEKFSYVSPIGAAGIYYGATAADFQRTGEPRTMFKTMIREIMALSYEMGYPFEKDYVDVNLKILASLPPDATTSMQRDVAAGRESELDGLLFNVVRMAKLYGVPMPAYEMVSEEIEKRISKSENE